jgi:hypothetical protein
VADARDPLFFAFRLLIGATELVAHPPRPLTD